MSNPAKTSQQAMQVGQTNGTPTEAEMRYSTARTYIFACKMIITSPHKAGRETTTILPSQMLAGFALELFLKAWLLKAGLSSGAVVKFGHDINALYLACKQHHLPEVAGLEEVVKVLADPHGDFTYRYTKPNATVTILGWPAAFPVFDALDAVVDEYIGASAAYGLLPGH